MSRRTPHRRQNTNGLTLQIDTRWAEGYGYRPFTLEVTASQAAADDRTLTVECGLSFRMDQNGSTATTQLTLPAGSTSVRKVMAVPQLTALQLLNVRTWEDGRIIEVGDHEELMQRKGLYSQLYRRQLELTATA